MLQYLKHAALLGAALMVSPSAQAARRGLGSGLEQMAQSYESGSEKLTLQLQHHLRDGAGNPLVRIVLTDEQAAKGTIAQLNAVGFQMVARSQQNGRVVDGYLPIGSARFALNVPGVVAAHAVPRPVTMAGLALNQGVALEKADKVQARGFTGKGIRIGALSDSFDACPDCSDHAADNEASGDLPPTVTVLEDLLPTDGGEDEGRAMLQEIHDLAPDAQLAFATAFESESDFANNVVALRTQFHADVIVDDVVYFDEPFYSDGEVAQAVNQAVSLGAAYFSSALNNGQQAYEADYQPVPFAVAEQLTAHGFQNIKVDQIPAAIRPQSFHNFGNGDFSVNLTNRYTPIGGLQEVDFQWDEPFYLGKVKTDYNLYLFDKDGNFIDPNDGNVALYSVDDNTQTDAPMEFLEVVPTEVHGGEPLSDYQIVVGKMNDGPARRFKYVTINGAGVSRLQGAPSVFGHNSASGAQAVAAMYYPITNFPEDFSSPGPTTILLDDNGNRLRHPDVRPTPQITAADGVDTTFFPPGGGDPDHTGFPNFFGTSAAAPNAAGVAALMIQAAGGPGSLRPREVYEALQETATAVPLPDDRSWSAAFAGPVIFNATGDFTREYHYFNLTVEPFLRQSVVSVSFDATNTPTGLTWNPNPARFDVAPGSSLTAAQVGHTVSADVRTLTLTFASGTFGAGDQLHFQESIFTPIEGTVEEAPDRLRNMKITVTLSNGQSYSGTVFAATPKNYNRFTGFGLVNADAAVRSVQHGGHH